MLQYKEIWGFMFAVTQEVKWEITQQWIDDNRTEWKQWIGQKDCSALWGSGKKTCNRNTDSAGFKMGSFFVCIMHSVLFPTTPLKVISKWAD